MYKFSKLVDKNNPHCTHSLELITADSEMTLESMCEAFEDFLRGSGFVFDGHVQIVDDSYAAEIKVQIDTLINETLAEQDFVGWSK